MAVSVDRAKQRKQRTTEIKLMETEMLWNCGVTTLINHSDHSEVTSGIRVY